jgi:2-iminobutanoate/2-iminopropanoate deaminase
LFVDSRDDALRYLNLPGDLAGAFPYSQAVQHRGLLFVAGQLASDDPEWTGADASIEAQTCAAMHRIGRILTQAGAGFQDVIRVGVYLTDLGLFDRMNQSYRSFFAGPNLPARTCVGVASLLSGGLIEIDCVARLRGH